MNKIAVLGCDPGVRGGLAVLAGDGRVAHVRAFYPDMTRNDLSAALYQAMDLLKAEGSLNVYLEKVNTRPGEGHQGAFTFGRVYGGLEQAFLAHGAKLHDVYPMTWQGRLECMSAGNKNVTKARAAQLFPGVKMTHAVADALLIAEHGRRCLNP